MRPVACAIALTLASGCQLNSRCDLDADCGGDLICADTRECASIDDAPEWRITWTINGSAVSFETPGDCPQVSELAIRVRSALNGESLNFRPVRCDLGQFEFRALPTRFDRLSLDALDGDDVVGGVDARREEITAVDLRF